MEYALTDAGLELVRDGRAVLSIPYGGTLGVLVQMDGPGFGSVLRHGPAEDVERDHRRRWATLMRGRPSPEGAMFARALGIPEEAQAEAMRQLAAELEYVAIPVDAVTPEVLEEVNACLSCTGRAGRLAERLGALSPAPGAPSP